MQRKSSRSRKIAASITLALAATTAAACGGDSGGGDSATATPQASNQAPTKDFKVVIGDLVPLTGDLSAFGPPGRKSAELAVAELQSAIRESGAKVDMTMSHADTETSEQASVQAARQLVSGGAGCIAGPWASSETKPVGSSVAARQRVPIISPSATSADISDLQDRGFVFRTAPSDALQAVALADTIDQALGGATGTISLAGRNDAYGEGFTSAFQAEWERRGGKIQGPVLYDPVQPAYNSEAGQIVANSPDAFVMVDFPETFAKMGAALARTGDFDPKKLFVTDGLAADEVPGGIPNDAIVAARGTRPGTPESGRVADAFNTLYTSAKGPGRQTFDGQTFDAAMLCGLGAVAAGSGKGPDIQAQLQKVSAAPGKKYTYLELPAAVAALQKGEDIDFDGVTGPIDFDDNGDPTAATYELWTYDPQGKLQVERQFQTKAQS